MRLARRASIWLKLLPGLLLGALSCLPALSQSMTTITATSVTAAGSPVNGTLCLTAVDRYGNPITVTNSASVTFIATWPFCQTLTTGALAGSLSVPNSVTDSIPGHPYRVVVYPNPDTPAPAAPSGTTTSSVGVDLGIIYGIGGSTWSLDSFIPPSTAPTAAAFTFTTGSGSHPTSCVAPAIDARDNTGTVTVGVCFAGIFIDISGSGGGGGGPPVWLGPWSSISAYVTGDAVSYNGSSYVAIASGTNQQPDTSPSYWTLIAQAGAAGTNGTDGTAGTPANWLGTWGSGTAYSINDAVTYSGSSYVAIAAGTNEEPDTSPTFWQLIAAAGAAGATGPGGPTGAAGATGATGASGGGFIWEGTWSNATTYTLYQAVSYSGSSYVNLTSSSLNQEPDTNPMVWQPLALQAVSGAEVVAFSATPTFSTQFNVSRIILTGNITSFTLPATVDGQLKTLCFQQGSGPYTVTAPSNVLNLPTLGTTNGKWYCSDLVYDNTDSVWVPSSRTFATTPATSNLLKGMGSENGVTAATPGTDYVVPAGNVGTSSALAATPTQCSSGEFSTGIAANGNANCTTPASVAGAEVVSYSATPTFSTAFTESRIVLTGNVTSFTLGAGVDGQFKTLCFEQGSGPYTVQPPGNVRGFLLIGTTSGKWNCQSYNYDTPDVIWLATSTGVINE